MGDKCTYLNIDGSDRNAMEDIFRLRSDISKEMKEFKIIEGTKIVVYQGYQNHIAIITTIFSSRKANQ